MKSSSLSWLSHKKLEHPVFIENELDRIIAKPKATTIQQSTQPEHALSFQYISAPRAEKFLLKKVINNSHWHPLVQKQYLVTRRNKTQLSQSKTKVHTCKARLPILSLSPQKKRETSIPKLRQKLRPFFQDVGQIDRSRTRYQSVTTIERAKKKTLCLKPKKVQVETSLFKVHQIEWRKRLLPSFEENIHQNQGEEDDI